MHVVLVLIGMALGVIRYSLSLATIVLFTFAWAAGWVLASGFWSTLFAVVMPPWGWYLIAEAVLQRLGLL